MLLIDSHLCGECGGCVAICSLSALELFPSGLKINHDLCILCEDCVAFCPTGALKMTYLEDQACASVNQTPRQENGR